MPEPATAAAPATAPPTPSTGLFGFFERMFALVDRPWKAFALAGLVLVGIAGAIAWENRGQLAGAMMTRSGAAHLEAERFDKLAPEIARDTAGDMVELVEASFAQNRIRTVAGWLKDRPGWQPDPRPRPMLANAYDPHVIGRMLEGQVICLDVDPAGGIVDHELAELGMVHRCVIAVPPVMDYVVGGLMVAWREKPPPYLEEAGRVTMRGAATQLATW